MEEEILYKVEVQGITSIESLTKANKELREERKKLDLDSVDGQKRVKEINDNLDKNTQRIKENVSALEKQKINIGNYKSALDGLVPGLGGMTSGIQATTTASKAFIATPIGAVIGALGLALAALTAYFKGSEEGQDALGRGTQVLKGIFQALTVVIEKVGGVVFATFDAMFSGFQKLLDFVAPALGAMLKNVVDTGVAIAKMEEELGDIEDDLILKRAETAKRVAELRSKAIAQEGESRKKTIQEAIRLEEELAAKEVELAQKSLDYFLADQKTRGAITGEEKTRIAELKAAVIDAEAQKFQATLRFTKELEKLNEEGRKKAEEQRELLKEELRLKEQLAIVEERLNIEGEKEIAQYDPKIKGKLNVNAANVKEIKLTEEQSDLLKRKEDLKKQELASAIAVSAALIGLNEKETASGKFLGLTTILTNAGIGVSNAIRAGSGIPFPGNIAAILTGVTAVLTGITQAKGFLGFAQGGLTGTRIMSHHGLPINRSNGDNRLATVRTGEVILNERQQAALGGSKTFARIGVPGFAEGGFVSSTARQSENNINSLFNAFSQVPIVVTVEDINAGVNRVGSVVNRARVIG